MPAMLPQSFRRALLSSARSQCPNLQPRILPTRARLSTATSTSTDPPVADLPLLHKEPKTPIPDRVWTQETSSTQSLSSTAALSPLAPSPASSKNHLPPSLLTLLPQISTQSPHYATLHIHGRPYLLTAGDRLRLPFLMHGVQPGDILRLTAASTLGSRDYTLRGAPWVDPRLFEARAVVAGVESEPMRVMEKTKRRQRRIKRVWSKHKYTELIVRELRVRAVEEVGSDVLGAEEGSVEGNEA